MNTNTAGVAIDDWKLSIFTKHLNASGFTFTEAPGLTKDTRLLMVEYSELASLWRCVEAANNEALKRNLH